MDEVIAGVKAIQAFNKQMELIQEACATIGEMKVSGELDTLPQADLAKLNCTVAYAVNSMIWMYYKASGVQPAETPVKRELDRIRRVMERLMDQKGGERPFSLDKDAAKRMVSASLPKESRTKGAENKPLNLRATESPPTPAATATSGKRKRANSSDPLSKLQGPSKKTKGNKEQSRKVYDH